MAIGDPPSNINSLVGVTDMWSHISKQVSEHDKLHQLMQAQLNVNAQQTGMLRNIGPPPITIEPSNLTLGTRARELFLKRMGGIRAEMKVDRDDFLQCHVYNGQVYVFYCFGGRHGVTLETIDLFPSDQLITQFRLVLT